MSVILNEGEEAVRGGLCLPVIIRISHSACFTDLERVEEGARFWWMLRAALFPVRNMGRNGVTK